MVCRVLALDPGGTTGWASITMFKNNQVAYASGLLQSQEHHTELYGLLSQTAVDVDDYRIVCESFEYRNQSRPGLELISKEYIGVTKLYCQLFDVPLTMQTASQGKAFTKDENIKKLGLWSTQRDDRHAMDAYRHLFVYLIHNPNADVSDEIRIMLLKNGWK